MERRILTAEDDERRSRQAAIVKKMPPELVIFDCDGVLVDTEGATNALLADNLSRYGPALTAEQCIEKFVGGTMADVGRHAQNDGYDLPDTWIDEIYREMFARLAEGVDLLPGVMDMLDQLDRSAIPYCVGSNGPMKKMEITLGPSGLWQRLEGRIFSPHVIGMEHAKPAPGLFLHAAHAMGVAPADAIVVEDSYGGACAARSAGIRCFGLVGMTSKSRLLEAGAIPIDEIADLSTFLKLDKP